MLHQTRHKGNGILYHLIGFALLVGLTCGQTASADAPALSPDHPERYVVQRGDTLWGIAGRYLQKPWRWPEIWQANPGIENPDLIYPNDVLVMDYSGTSPKVKLLRSERHRANPRLPVVKLSPRAYSSPIHQAIPTLPVSQVMPFLRDTLVMDDNELKDAGYVAVGTGDEINLGKFSEFYARNLDNASTGDIFKIYRQGKNLKHPDTNEELGYEAVFLGDARVTASGEISRLEITRSRAAIEPGDRLLKTSGDIEFPTYQPHAPERQVKGRILRSSEELSMSELGPTSIVILSLGEREGLENGNVLRILHHGGKRIDPVTRKRYQLPDEDSGLLMIFKTYPKVSYGLVLNSVRPVQAGDFVVTP